MNNHPRHPTSSRRVWLARTLRAGALALLGALAACRDSSPAPATRAPTGTPPAPAPLRVVATTGMLADTASHVGGARTAVTGLMGEGVDPHLYKASPGDVRTMSAADIIFYNGLHLEGRLADVIVRMAARTTVVQATDTISEKALLQPAEFEGHYDPHVWFDVSLWRSVVSRVRDALSAKDPAGSQAYARAAADYDAVLADLHDYARACTATIPPANRLLVTAHDAFGYFSRAYAVDVLAIQGISTDSEASLRDINALVDTLVSRKVPAVFIESSVPRKTIDALIEGCAGRGHTVTIGAELFSDALGPAGTPEGTYVGMVLHNVEAITRALGGTLPPSRPARIEQFLHDRFPAAASPKPTP